MVNASDIMITEGFIQGHEFFKKSGNLQSNFPDLEKCWKED